MSGYVPAATSIRKRSVRNVDTTRLFRRRVWLADHIVRPGVFRGSRNDFAHKARELKLIEDELVARGARLCGRLTRAA